MAKHARSLYRNSLLRQLLVVIGFFELYQLTRMLVQPHDMVSALQNAQRVFELEGSLHLAWEQTLQRAFLALPHLVEAMNLFYFAGHFCVTGLFFLWLFFRSRDDFYYYRNGFMAASLLALLVYWSFPTAPPRLADVGLEDTLRLLSGIDIGTLRGSAYSNPVAAVPSLHAGWAVCVGFGVFSLARRRWLRLLAVFYPFAIVTTIVVTGNHFVLDAVAGVLVMGLGFALLALLRRVRRTAEPAEATAS